MPEPGLNIVYIHTHDMGRYCQPMGFAIPAPNLLKLARQGVIFRKAFAAAPSCAPSRAALLTGEYPHTCGMMGLPAAGLGYRIHDYSHHLSNFLKLHGYETALSGVQHEAFKPWADPEKMLGYDHYLNQTASDGHNKVIIAAAAIDFLAGKHEKPFFLSVGFTDPHRANRRDTRSFIQSLAIGQAADIDDEAAFCQPMPHLPDNAITRREMVNFKRGVANMDHNVGLLLQALDVPELRDNTLVIFTTDHGPGMPDMKCTLSDRGTGVTLILRGPGGFSGGRAIDGLCQHMDLFPTICGLTGIEPPAWLQGRSLVPLAGGQAEQIHEAIFTEQTYHAEARARPFRAVRTARHKYIRCYDPECQWGVDGGPVDAFWRQQGYGSRPHPREELYDLCFDPNEADNLATRPGHEALLAEMRGRLERWQAETDDPIRGGQVPLAPAMLQTRQDANASR